MLSPISHIHIQNLLQIVLRQFRTQLLNVTRTRTHERIVKKGRCRTKRPISVLWVPHVVGASFAHKGIV